MKKFVLSILAAASIAAVSHTAQAAFVWWGAGGRHEVRQEVRDHLDTRSGVAAWLIGERRNTNQRRGMVGWSVGDRLAWFLSILGF